MRALIINPWIYDFAAYDLWAKPIGLFKLIYILDRLGFVIDYIDCLDRFHPRLTRWPKPSRYLTRYGDGKYLTRRVRSRFSAPIVLGGVYAILCPEHAEENSGADIVFTGAEQELIEMINQVLGKRFPPVEITGLDYYRIGYRYYAELRYITLRTSQGCPFRCPYCGWYRISPHLHREDPEAVVDLITEFHQKGIRDFAFYDDALLYRSEEHFLPIFAKLLEMGIRARFHSPNGLYFEDITEPVAEVMYQARFIKPRIGFEDLRLRSGDGLIQAVERLTRAGYRREEIYANILVGLPDQTVADVYRTIEFIQELGIGIHLEEYSPVPGSATFTAAGLSRSDDPLRHNNTAYLLTHPIFGPQIDRIKQSIRRTT